MGLLLLNQIALQALLYKSNKMPVVLDVVKVGVSSTVNASGVLAKVEVTEEAGSISTLSQRVGLPVLLVVTISFLSEIKYQ